MTDPDTISADYTLHPSELAETLALLVEARQLVVLWGAPGSAKSAIAQQVATEAGRQYVDVRALLLDPVDLRGIPWRDGADRTRWAPPAFLPPTDDPGRWLINLEELPSAVPMVQASLYQLVLDRKVGEYELPEGASLIAYQRRLKIRPRGGARDCHLGWWSELGVRLGVGDTVRGFFGGSGQRSHAELKRSAPAGRPQGGMVYRVGARLATRASEARCRPGPGDGVPQFSYRRCFCGRGFG